MIGKLQGIVDYIAPDHIILMTGGVGYRVYTPENLRSGERLLHRDTITRMTCPQISKNAEKALTAWGTTEYSYGLGVRCPKPHGTKRDYGWGGAAGAYLAIIPEQEVSLFYVQHVLSSPVQQIRKQLPDIILKDLQ